MEIMIILVSLAAILYINKETGILLSIIQAIFVFIGILITILPLVFKITVCALGFFFVIVAFTVRTPFYILGGFLYEKNYVKFCCAPFDDTDWYKQTFN